MSKHYTDAEYEAAWHACVKVRDAAPRLPLDADSNDVVRAVLDAVAPAIAARAKAEAWDEAAEAVSDWMWNNPSPSGIPHDPPRNPYADEIEAGR